MTVNALKVAIGIKAARMKSKSKAVFVFLLLFSEKFQKHLQDR